MRRADEPTEPDPLPRLPRDVLALMASVGTRLRDVAVVPAARASTRGATKARTPRMPQVPRVERRRITVAEGWAPRPSPI